MLETNKIKSKLISSIQENFPELADFIVDDNSSTILDYPNPNKAEFGGLIVQYHLDDIWLRAYLPASGGPMDSIDETIQCIKDILDDKLLIVIGSNSEGWQETTLQFSNKKLALEKGLDYAVISWSGKLDKKVNN